jgi:ABC-type uncharacterized transport system substrate-binding protein
MRRKTIVVLLIGLVLALARFADAQQHAKVSRIGIVVVPPLPAVAPRLEAFSQRLREFGYVEGKSIIIESRSAEGKLERVPALAAELVRLKIDVIVSGGPGNDSSCHGRAS